jgi:hypothetical protein
MCGQIIQLLCCVAYSIFAYKTHWGVSIRQMDLPHCLSISLGVTEIIQNNSTLNESGN